MHPAIRVCHFVSSTSRCWSRACMCCPRAVARSVGLVRRHRCPRTQTRSVTLGVRGSPAPWSAVRPVRASTLDISYSIICASADSYRVACSTPGLYRTLPTYRSVGASAMRCGGWRVVTSFTRVTFSFSTRAWPAVGSAGTRRILSSKTVTFAGFFGSRRGPRSRGAGESSRGAVRVTFRLRFVTGESPDLACTLVAAAQRTTLL